MNNPQQTKNSNDKKIEVSAMTCSLVLSDHAKRRCAQRGIQPGDLDVVVRYGKCIYRQGFRFYILRNKDLPRKMKAHKRGRLKNVVVVTSSDTPHLVVTVYRNANAPGKIKRKNKTLL